MHGLEESPARLRVLGTFGLSVDGQRAELPLQAQRVLGCLAVGEPEQSRLAMAGRLWGDASQERASATLRNALWRIRQAGDKLLVCSRDAVALRGDVAVDLQDAQVHAEELLGDGALELDGQLIELFSHDLLPQWDEDWLLVERERLRQLRIHALEALSASLRRAGRYPAAIQAALAAVSAEPLRESAQAALIKSHLGEGNVCEAIRQLEAYRRLLADELGIHPSPGLEQLVVDRPGVSAPSDR